MPCTGFALVPSSTLSVFAKTCELKQVTKPVARSVGVVSMLYLVLQTQTCSLKETPNPFASESMTLGNSSASAQGTHKSCCTGQAPLLRLETVQSARMVTANTVLRLNESSYSVIFLGTQFRFFHSVCSENS